MNKKTIISKVFSFASMFALVFSMGSLGAVKAQASVEQTPATNPSLSESCGMKVVLVLDSSDSMSDNDITTVKNAANSLVSSLMPANPVGVIDFDTNIVNSVDPTVDITTVTNAINSIGHTDKTEYTNWDAALTRAGEMVGKGDLVVIITDGNPTTSDGALSDINDAIVKANAIKNNGARILAIGINSSGTQGGLNQDNLEKISGKQVVSGTFSDINLVDVYLGDIATLGSVLADLTTALCGGQITVTKMIDTGNQETISGGANWTFKVNGTNYTTDEIGSISVPINEDSTNNTVVEVTKEGFPFESVSCTNGTQTQGQPKVTGISVTSLTTVNCTFVNNESLSLAYTAGANGSLTGSALQTVNRGSDGTEVTAVANPNYHFTSWSDGVTTASRTDINVQSSKEVTASFALNPTPIDLCLNITEIQIEVPQGMETNSDHICTEIVIPTEDVCPNIGEIQTSVPYGMYINKNGDCVKKKSSGGSSGGSVVTKPTGQVLGAETSCGIYVDKFLKKGLKANDKPTVEKIQKFLNDYMNSGLKIDGIFGTMTDAAVKAFQIKHSDKILTPWSLTKPTGIFYLTTQTEVNNIMCPTLNLPIPELIPLAQNGAFPKM